MALNGDVENLNETAQADDTNPQSGFPLVVERELWLAQTITPIQQLLHIGVDLTGCGDVDVENAQNSLEYQGDLLRGLDKAELLLHWRKQAEQAKDLKTRDYSILQASRQALSFEQLQALLASMLDRVLLVEQTQASVHRFALSSVVFPLLREWNKQMIHHLLVQWLILNDGVCEGNLEELKARAAFYLNGIFDCYSPTSETLEGALKETLAEALRDAGVSIK